MADAVVSRGKMLDCQRQRVDIPAHARIAHNGLPKKKKKTGRGSLLNRPSCPPPHPHPIPTQSVKRLYWTVLNWILDFNVLSISEGHFRTIKNHHKSMNRKTSAELHGTHLSATKVILGRNTNHKYKSDSLFITHVTLRWKRIAGGGEVEWTLKAENRKTEVLAAEEAYWRGCLLARSGLSRENISVRALDSISGRKRRRKKL